MDYIRLLDGDKAHRAAIEDILKSSLREKDFFSRESFRLLSDQGIDSDDAALALLAHYKSEVKYGCVLSQETIVHILALSTGSEEGAALRRLIRSPYFLAKTCWLYEHAPYFLFHDTGRSSARDHLILDFSKQYESRLFKSSLTAVEWEKVEKPYRVCATTFWESDAIDPLLLLKYARDKNIEGIEMSVDFHPFNIFKLLPEDFTPEKRRQIKAACRRSGIKLDIHSPIVGPCSPAPDPAIGKPSFFNPVDRLEMQYEVVDLAKEIGAGAVVFHLIDRNKLKELATLVERAAGSNVIVTIENYCQTEMKQTADEFIACINEIFNALPGEIRRCNFGITIDVGHLNIEGDDPLTAAGKIGQWCRGNRVPFRLHATDNYGDLLYNPPAYSADVHSNVTGRGINNAVIIKLLRGMGHEFDVVAEQIQPLAGEEIAYIHAAQTSEIDKSYSEIVEAGRKKLSTVEFGRLIVPDILKEEAYLFLAGLEGVAYLREYLLYRKIQNKENLSVDEAKQISGDIMKMPQKFKKDIVTYIDDLLLPVQSETGALQKIDKDVLFHNISGALFTAISNEHLDQVFSKERDYSQGDVICAEKTSGHEMYFIKRGEVGVHIGDNVATLGPGEIFGEMSLFYNTLRTATVTVASEAATVGILTRKGLEDLFRSCHSYAHDLVYRLYNILPERLRNINEKYKTVLNKLSLLSNGNGSGLPGTKQVQLLDIHEKAAFFPTLSQNDAKEIYNQIVVFDKDEPVFSEGDTGIGAYYIVDGRVKVVGLSPDGAEISMGELGPGEIFGEMALIDKKPRAASVIALTPCTLGFIDKSAFNQFIEARSDLAFRLMNYICLTLFNHILRIDKRYAEIRRNLKTFGSQKGV